MITALLALAYLAVGALVTGILARVMDQDFTMEDFGFSIAFWPVSVVILLLITLHKLTDAVSGGRMK